jgi:predicted NUDIX family NTP pyrophosphohydrolase
VTTRSAGIALYRTRNGGDPEVFLGRFGGPYWRNEERAWGIPKGVYDPEREAAEDAARREFEEETGFEAPDALTHLGVFEIGSDKIVDVFTGEGNVDPEALESDSFTIEWPPDTGQMRSFPELERGAWFSLNDAIARVVKSQIAVIEALAELVDSGREDPD